MQGIGISTGGKTLVLPSLYPKQEEFCTAEASYIGYGGARGGGKSHVVRIKAILLAEYYPGIQILLLRRTYPELYNNHVIPFLKLLNCKAKNPEDRFAEYKVSDKEILFANGSRIKLGYCASPLEVFQYQGQSYEAIFFDEATLFEKEIFDFIKSSNRLSGVCKKAIKPRMYFTANPGGVGHIWFKKLFIDKTEKESADSVFIQSLVYDNEFLMENNPEYVERLEELPDKLKQAFLYGSWNCFDGQYFAEFSEKDHVIDPIPIRSNWKIYRARDYGFDMLACYWIAVDEYENAYVFNELYQSGLIATIAGQKINEINNGMPIWKDLVPPDLFAKNNTDNKSPVDYWAELGQNLTKASNDRVNGWTAVREWLKIVETEDYDGVVRPHAKLRIFRNCVNLIRTLPQLFFSSKNPNDCATEPHEITHAPDALRYFCASWTFASQPTPQQSNTNWIDAWIKKTVNEQSNSEVKGVYNIWQ
jgi:phage terminase large subunit